MRWLGLCLLLVLYGLLSAQSISFTNAGNDLARHIRDGEQILTGRAELLYTNVHSWAHPEARFVNHHWLTTVIFFALFNVGGVSSIHLAYIFAGMLSLILYLRLAIREAGWWAALLVALVLLPVTALRAGVRTEIASILLLAVCTTILWEYYRGRVRGGWLWCLPLIHALWVNLHPGFVLGWVLIGAFLVSEAVRRWIGYPATHRSVGLLASVFGASVLACLANPNGWRGAVLPFTFSVNYGIAVSENLPLWVFHGIAVTPTLIAIDVALLAVAASFAWKVLRKEAAEWPLLLVAIPKIGVALFFYRAYVFLGYFAVLAVSVNLGPARDQWRKRPWSIAAAAALAGGILLNAAMFESQRSRFGLGLQERDGEMAEFLIRKGISGRVFNNYNSGGYLIFHRPGEGVYVDSRPEAYPSTFLRDEYTAAIQDEAVWFQVHGRRRFDYILFVPAIGQEQQFLTRRWHDPEWALVYLNDLGAVLVRRVPGFARVIEQFERKPGSGR